MVESPWQARQSSLVGLGSGFFCPAKLVEAIANTRPSTPNFRSLLGLQEFFSSAGMSILLQNPLSTALLLLGRMGQAAVRTLTPRGDHHHRASLCKCGRRPEGEIEAVKRGFQE